MTLKTGNHLIIYLIFQVNGLIISRRYKYNLVHYQMNCLLY